MNDFLLDPCDTTRPHGPHKYGSSRRDENGRLQIVHPLHCPGLVELAEDD